MKKQLLLLSLAVPLMAGCGGRRLPAPADPDRAREAVCSALDAWQRGEPPDAPGGAAAAVRVSDPDWAAGCRLAHYQVAANGVRTGLDLCYPVTLTLRDRQGKTVRKTTTYLVGTSPIPTVVRHDSDS